jgi:23S rRNA pseudouridine2605 synthase
MATLERLQKFLARAGVASRRAAEQLIVDGRVSVNGKPVKVLGSKVDAQKDIITVNAKLVVLKSERQWFLFYKPPGVVTTMKDPQGRPTISDYIGAGEGRVFPVGRLDYDAEGALLLTDDGETANKLMHPKHQVPRVYLAKVKSNPSDGSLEKLKSGVRLEDGMAKALVASRFREAEKNTWIKLIVTEGRQHLIKRMCAAIGHPVLRLYRPSHAGISVSGVRPGQYRALTNDEIRRVKSAADGATFAESSISLPARRHGHAAPGFEPEPEEQIEEDLPLADTETAAPKRSVGLQSKSRSKPTKSPRDSQSGAGGYKSRGKRA